jgi:CheY-like chemotaxis protein
VNRANLCVDDEAIILMALKQELRSVIGPGFIYETARDGIEALEVVDSLVAEGIKLVLVISDWLMPGLAGDELVLRLKDRHPDVQAIIITGQANDA